MSHASEILAMIDSQDWAALTLEGRYGVLRSGERIVFDTLPAPSVLNVRRHETTGRVLQASFRYPDDSIIHFRWGEHLGAKYSIGKS